jgi:hypothetical protein
LEILQSPTVTTAARGKQSEPMELHRRTGNSAKAQQSERESARSGRYRAGLLSIITGVYVLLLLISVDRLSVYAGQRQQTGQVEYDILSGLAAGVLYYIYIRG